MVLQKCIYIYSCVYVPRTAKERALLVLPYAIMNISLMIKLKPANKQMSGGPTTLIGILPLYRPASAKSSCISLSQIRPLFKPETSEVTGGESTQNIPINKTMVPSENDISKSLQNNYWILMVLQYLGQYLYY
jgi:hypothetical protein